MSRDNAIGARLRRAVLEFGEPEGMETVLCVDRIQGDGWTAHSVRASVVEGGTQVYVCAFGLPEDKSDDLIEALVNAATTREEIRAYLRGIA